MLRDVVDTLVDIPLAGQFLRNLLRVYHWSLPRIGAAFYRNPSKKLRIIGVTGTKGKSSTTEMLNAIFEEAGEKTAVLNSIRIKVADLSEPNTMRMSMPGRFFIQHFLSRAARANCSTVILEMTSEGARQYRHHNIDLDVLVFTNLAPEHIESHGSFKAYADTKFSITDSLTYSSKRPRTIVANADDPESARYLALPVERKLPFSLHGASPSHADERKSSFTFEGMRMSVPQPGEFSIKNALAAAAAARACGVSLEKIARALAKIERILGRAERIEVGSAFTPPSPEATDGHGGAPAGKQDFAVIVDYAHTPDSLRALYDAYKGKRLICVLGATGGGRDAWKRPVMGKIADENCAHVILTNEDPYDEDPRAIVDMVARDMERKPEIIMDRRGAISRALHIARTLRQAEGAGNQDGIAVLISGKGTDPNICGPRGTKIPWSDATVAREELVKLQGSV